MTLIPQNLFRDLDVPMLIVDPCGDVLDMKQQNRRLQAAHPALIRHAIYEDSGHNILGQKPQRFLADLSGFLKEIDAR